MRVGRVYLDNQFVGQIQESDEGYIFQYDSSYVQSLSPQSIGINYPIQSEPFFSKTIPPFFDGLIPEGWLLTFITKNWKLNPKDRMGILLKACRDCIGAVSIEEETE